MATRSDGGEFAIEHVDLEGKNSNVRVARGTGLGGSEVDVTQACNPEGPAGIVPHDLRPGLRETEVQDSIYDQIQTRVLRLEIWSHGIAGGVVAGGLLAAATIWLLVKGGDPIGPHISLLGQFFPGYSVTWFGSLIGFGYGFMLGFLASSVTVLLYNHFARALDEIIKRHRPGGAWPAQFHLAFARAIDSGVERAKSGRESGGVERRFKKGVDELVLRVLV